MITLCIPVLRRYDLLRKALLTATKADPGPDKIFLIDNGRQPYKLHDAIFGIDRPFETLHPEVPMGVAESWNHFIRNTEEHRIISNDDIEFAPHSFRTILDTPGDVKFAAGWSCFQINDRCINEIGLFDETISPGYAYFEDCDYAWRIEESVKKGGDLVMVNVFDHGVVHLGSQTWQSGTPEEIDRHWIKFNIAKANFRAKWGRLPT